MWFKNLRVFCLTRPFDLSFEDLESQLADNAFIPCANYEKSRIGWVSPLGDVAPETEEEQAPMLAHIVGDYIMLCAQKQEKLLPASVVREATAEKVTEIEMRQKQRERDQRFDEIPDRSVPPNPPAAERLRHTVR